MRFILSAAGLIIAGLFCTAVQAAPGDTIGQAIAIKNDVTAAFANDRRLLAKDDPVRQEEVIEVGENSLGELKFKDDTKLALGPGSRMTLDKFVYDPEKTNGSIVVNLLKGTFRFITGLAEKPSYQIKTPSASISVRGTIFDVYIRPDGSTWLLLIEGAIEVCTPSGKCRVLDEPGKFIEVSEHRRKGKRASGSGGPGGWTVGAPVKWAALPGRRSTPIETAFPFVPAAPSFDPDPWYSVNDIMVGRFPRHPRHPHLPPRGDGGKGPYPGRDPGTKPPPDSKPPVILKGDHPVKVRPPRVQTSDPVKPKPDKPVVKVVRHRDRSDPVVRHKHRDPVHVDKLPRRQPSERVPKTERAPKLERAPRFAGPKEFISKPILAPKMGSNGGSFGRGGFGGGMGGGFGGHHR